MGTSPALNSTSDTTALTNMLTDERVISSSGQDLTSSCVPPTRELCLFGENTSTTLSPSKQALNVPSSGTKHPKRGSRPSLCDRLTPSLIMFGLVRGTTPKSVRRQLGAKILDAASKRPDGGPQ